MITLNNWKSRGEEKKNWLFYLESVRYSSNLFGFFVHRNIFKN